MPKIIVRDNEMIDEAIRRFRTTCRLAGVLTGNYVRMVDRNRQKYYYESKGVKDKRRRKLAMEQIVNGNR